MKTLATLVGISIVVLIWAIIIYNKLQGSMQSIREALSNLQASMKQRVDLTNQVIDIASGYGEHEKLTHVSLSNNMEGAIKRVSALAQNYPQLRANETYQKLMDQLERLEKIIFERRATYNQTVKTYNSLRNSFPNVIIASKLKFETAPYFEPDEVESLEKLKMFERDDSEALRLVLNKGGDAVKKSVIAAKTTLSEKINEQLTAPSDAVGPKKIETERVE